MNITIIGAGDIGYHLAGMLASEKKNVVLVDQNEEALNRIGNEFDLLTVCGSATSPRVLDKAGVRNADLIIAATNIDEVNILAAPMKRRSPYLGRATQPSDPKSRFHVKSRSVDYPL